jgi:hypothetical protein
LQSSATALEDLEGRLAETFAAEDWDLDAPFAADEFRVSAENDLVRPVNMDLVILAGSRPSGN